MSSTSRLLLLLAVCATLAITQIHEAQSCAVPTTANGLPINPATAAAQLERIRRSVLDRLSNSNNLSNDARQILIDILQVTMA